MLKKARAFLLSALSGMLSLALVNGLAGITGFTLGSGWLVLCTAVLLGLPGVVLMLFTRLLTG